MRFLFFLMIGCLLMVSAQAQTTAGNPDSSKIEFKVVQVQAKFPGGAEAWTKYLQTNLKADLGAKYIKLKRGEQQAQQTVMVSFLVDKQGNIFEVHALNADEVHPKIAAEAVRVIKEGPKWIPAVQDGKNVIYRQRQSITFAVARG